MQARVSIHSGTVQCCYVLVYRQVLLDIQVLYVVYLARDRAVAALQDGVRQSLILLRLIEHFSHVLDLQIHFEIEVAVVALELFAAEIAVLHVAVNLRELNELLGIFTAFFATISG